MKSIRKRAWQPSVASYFVYPLILGVLFLGQDFFGSTPAFGLTYKVTPVAQITINAEGQHIHFPSYIFYDRSADETYLINGGKQEVVVYAGDFFPLASFSSGRGIYRPQDGFVDSKGLIYICQSADKEKPARITVLNGAFMIVREIYLDNIPKFPDFRPARVAVNKDGLIYVAGQHIRGVVVLDNDGTFLRWLRPEDMTYALPDVQNDQSSDDAGTAEKGESGEASKGESVEASAESPKKDEKATYENIPEQFRPKTEEEKKAESGPHMGPVIIRSVSIDKEGRLYLLSDETSKTYVYSPEETFLFSFGVKGGTPRTLSNPRGVAIDENRHIIYVVDYMRHAILVYAQNNGEFMFEFGGKGKGPGWYNFPTDIAVNNRGQVIIADFFNHRAQVLDVKYQLDAIPSKPAEKASPPTAGSGKAEKAEAENEGSAGSLDGENEIATKPDEESAATSGDAKELESAKQAPLVETQSTREKDIEGDEPTEAPTAQSAEKASPPTEGSGKTEKGEAENVGSAGSLNGVNENVMKPKEEPASTSGNINEQLENTQQAPLIETRDALEKDIKGEEPADSAPAEGTLDQSGNDEKASGLQNDK